MNVNGYDITAAQYANRPVANGFLFPAFYGTGSPDIVATPAMLADNPYAIMIDQSPVITQIDTSLDIYDMETGALTVNELGEVIHDALANRAKGFRKGQRTPLVYFSDSRLSEVTTALDKAALQGKCGLHIAHWGVSAAQAAIRIMQTVHDPYPVKAFQYRNAGTYDLDVFELEWIATSGQYNHSWTSHGQHWNLGELAGKLGIAVTALAPGNERAHYAVERWLHGDHVFLIPLGAHFTYQKLPAVV